jgi:activator of HSP90 ATPase
MSPPATSIHRETLIAAAPQQVFELLTSGSQFSAATGMPAEITAREGDPFSIFGGRVEGRQIELVPSKRVVQAWRFGAAHPSAWEPGVYSTLRFSLDPAGDGTRLMIDHTGIPSEWIEHLSSGYPTFYQDPIEKFFQERIGSGVDVGPVARADLDTASHREG